MVTVPSMSDTTILAELLRRKMLARLVTTVPVLVSTLYSRLFTPDLRPSWSSCACVAELVLSFGSGSRTPSSADQNLMKTLLSDVSQLRFERLP